MNEKTYCVYILTNKPYGVLYTGVTGELQRRVLEHKRKEIDGFTKKYNGTRLIYVEPYEYVYDALDREKQIKHWTREWKVKLIEEHNPEWQDLYERLFGRIKSPRHMITQDSRLRAGMTKEE